MKILQSLIEVNLRLSSTTEQDSRVFEQKSVMFTRTLRVGMLTYYKMDLSKSIGYSWTITHKTGINSPFQMVQTTLKHLIKATKSTAKRQYIFFMSGEDYALVLDFINYISYFILHFFLQESSRFFQL